MYARTLPVISAAPRGAHPHAAGRPGRADCGLSGFRGWRLRVEQFPLNPQSASIEGRRGRRERRSCFLRLAGRVSASASFRSVTARSNGTSSSPNLALAATTRSGMPGSGSEATGAAWASRRSANANTEGKGATSACPASRRGGPAHPPIGRRRPAALPRSRTPRRAWTRHWTGRLSEPARSCSPRKHEESEQRRIQAPHHGGRHLHEHRRKVVALDAVAAELVD